MGDKEGGLTIKEDDLMETGEEGVGELSCESSYKIDSTDFVLEKEFDPQMIIKT